LRNNGSATIKNLPLVLRFNGLPVATETVTDSIVSGEQMSYTFNYKINLSNAGDYTIAVVAQLLGDASPIDNTLTKRITVTECLVSSQELPMNFGFEVFKWPVDCWTLIDKDGDGYYWSVGNNPANAHSGNSFGYSESFMSIVSGELEFPLTPDNWLISPPIQIPSTNSIELSFWKGAVQYGLHREHYAVLISVTDRDPASFTTVYEETLDTDVWQKRVLSLDAYKGQTIYIAFRHYNCTDEYGILLDDIKVEKIYSKDATLIGFEKVENITYGDEFPVTVTLYNNGIDTIKDAVITWTKDGVAQPQVQYSGALTRGEQVNIMLSASESFALGVNHSLTATVHLTGDENVSNDSINAVFFSKPYMTIPYITEFDGSLDEWDPQSYSGGLNFYWANQPHTYITLQSPTLSNGYALYDLVRNGLGGPSNALVSLVSPAFDFSSVPQGSPLSISFYHWTRNEITTECSLQYSTDNFRQDINTLWNWNSSVSQEIEAGKEMVAISDLCGAKDIRFRFLHYGSIGYGWAIDDIHIGNVEQQSEVAILSAQEEHSLDREGSDVTFYATVQNNGSANAVSLPVTFSVNDTVLNATVPSLSYGEKQTVSVLWCNAPAGNHTVTVSLPADEDITNNTFTFKKHIATAYQLAEGFEDVTTLDDWDVQGDLALTSIFSTSLDTVGPFVYEGVVSAVGGALYHVAYQSLIYTPVLNVSEGDKVVFYSKYLNEPYSSEMPTVQIIFSEDASTWYITDDDAFTLTSEWKDYTAVLPVAGQFHIGFVLTAPYSRMGSSVYIALDHIIAPPVADAFSVTFNVSNSDGDVINDAVVTFDGTESATGDYLFMDVFPGVYPYTVAKSGMETASGKVIVVNQDVNVNVSLENISGNEEVDMDDCLGAVITPNPVTRGGEATLLLNDVSGSLRVEICDLSGAVVWTASATSTKEIALNVGGLKAGVYFVRVTTDKAVVTKKLIRM
jgi:hypothetical protein